MKTVTFIAALVVASLLSGCGDNQSKRTTEINDPPKGWWNKEKYNGHVYVHFQGGYQGSCVHDPDCPCHEVRRQQFLKDIDAIVKSNLVSTTARKR